MSDGKINQNFQVRYKVGSDSGTPSELEYFVLTSMRVSTILLSVSLTFSRISMT